MDAATRRLLIVVQFCFGVFPAVGKIAMQPGAFSPTAVLVWRLRSSEQQAPGDGIRRIDHR